MANEASKIELYGNNSAGRVISWTVSSSGAIPKGTLMVLSASPRTIAAHSSAGEKFIGIANAEKDALDSSITLGTWTDGIFNVAASGSISDGDLVVLSDHANLVIASAAIADETRLVGMAIDDASAGRVSVRVNK
jgi:hypothetical protein